MEFYGLGVGPLRFKLSHFRENMCKTLSREDHLGSTSFKIDPSKVSYRTFKIDKSALSNETNCCLPV